MYNVYIIQKCGQNLQKWLLGPAFLSKNWPKLRLGGKKYILKYRLDCIQNDKLIWVREAEISSETFDK